ncbi:MAG: 6-phosphogluconolactonase [Mariprofundales bacterium]
MNFTRFPDAEAVAEAAAEVVAAECRQAVAARGVFHWVLAGGSSPQRCYQRLRQEADLPWNLVHCWFGDERLLPIGDTERNETAARDALLDHVPIPDAQIHAIAGDDPVASAAAYSREMAQVECFDLVLLGMGEDGHTASLFPSNPALTLTELAVPVFNSPKPPPLRVSMSFAALNNHHRCLLLVTGAGKKDPLTRICQGDQLPAGMVKNSEWMIDTAAFPTK